MSTISLAMIIKNEAACLPQSIGTLRAHVDQIVIGVDRSSEDNSLEVAKQLADIVFEFDFCTEEFPHGNFSRARNMAIAHCVCDWIFNIDNRFDFGDFGFLQSTR